MDNGRDLIINNSLMPYININEMSNSSSSDTSGDLTDDSSLDEPDTNARASNEQITDTGKTSLKSEPKPDAILETNRTPRRERVEDIIDINKIMYDAIMNNKIIFLSAIPLFVGYYLQDTIFTRSIATVTSDVPGFVDSADFNKLLILLLPYILAMILFYISNIVTSKALSKIELDSVQELTDQLIESIKTSKKAINVNDLIIHIKKIAGAKNIYSLIVTYIIPTFIVAMGLIYTFSQSDGPYSMLVAMIIIVMMLVTTKLEFESIEYAYDTEDSSNILFDEIHEIMSNIDSVITSNTKEKEMKNVAKVKDKTYRLAVKSQLNNNNSTYGLQLVSIVAMLGINYMSYRLYSQNLMDSVSFTSTVLLSLLFMDYYNYCIHAISDLISSMGRYYETRDYFLDFKIIKEPESEKARQIALKVRKGGVVFKNLTLKYENKMVFNNFNYSVEGGTVLGVVGPIGSGKTTMLKMLAGILDYEGEILIDGQNLKNCTYESIVEHIAYIPQHPKLFNRTVYYNLNYGSAYTKDEIMNKLESLGLKPFIDSLPDKLDTIAGKEGTRLSGGQKQFIFFIRSIIQNKSIFLLDEPSSSLDVNVKKILIDLIKSMKGKTIIISTHDRQIMPLFQKTLNMGKKSSYEAGSSKSSGQKTNSSINTVTLADYANPIYDEN